MSRGPGAERGAHARRELLEEPGQPVQNRVRDRGLPERLDRARAALRQVCERLGVRFSLGAPVLVGRAARARERRP